MPADFYGGLDMPRPTLPEDTGWMGDRKRGASFGRRDRPSLHPDASRKFHLRRIRLDAGGYDSGGAYWGIGTPLYWACCASGSIEFFFRAKDRIAAKAETVKRHPGARFYR